MHFPFPWKELYDKHRTYLQEKNFGFPDENSDSMQNIDTDYSSDLLQEPEQPAYSIRAWACRTPCPVKPVKHRSSPLPQEICTVPILVWPLRATCRPNSEDTLTKTSWAA